MQTPPQSPPSSTTTGTTTTTTTAAEIEKIPLPTTSSTNVPPKVIITNVKQPQQQKLTFSTSSANITQPFVPMTATTTMTTTPNSVTRTKEVEVKKQVNETQILPPPPKNDPQSLNCNYLPSDLSQPSQLSQPSFLQESIAQQLQYSYPPCPGLAPSSMHCPPYQNGVFALPQYQPYFPYMPGAIQSLTPPPPPPPQPLLQLSQTPIFMRPPPPPPQTPLPHSGLMPTTTMFSGPVQPSSMTRVIFSEPPQLPLQYNNNNNNNNNNQSDDQSIANLASCDHCGAVNNVITHVPKICNNQTTLPTIIGRREFYNFCSNKNCNKNYMLFDAKKDLSHGVPKYFEKLIPGHKTIIYNDPRIWCGGCGSTKNIVCIPTAIHKYFCMNKSCYKKYDYFVSSAESNDLILMPYAIQNEIFEALQRRFMGYPTANMTPMDMFECSSIVLNRYQSSNSNAAAAQQNVIFVSDGGGSDDDDDDEESEDSEEYEEDDTDDYYEPGNLNKRRKLEGNKFTSNESFATATGPLHVTSDDINNKSDNDLNHKKKVYTIL